MSCAQRESFLWSCKASWAEQQLPYSDSLHPYGSQTHSPTAARTANVKWCTKKNILCSVSASVQCISVRLWRQRGGAAEKRFLLHITQVYFISLILQGRLSSSGGEGQRSGCREGSDRGARSGRGLSGCDGHYEGVRLLSSTAALY